MARKKSKVINTKVAGVTFANEDGTKRQDIIKGLTMGERVLLVRDHENEHDFYAVQVQTMEGEVIGWVPRQKTPQIAPAIDTGVLVLGMVASRGKAQGKDLLGLNIDITLVTEEDRGWVEAELKRLSTPNLGEGAKPQIQVMNDDGFPLSLAIMCAALVLFIACGFAVCGA